MQPTSLRREPIRLATLALVFAATTAAQSSFEMPLQKSYLPLDQEWTGVVAHGDVDGDGDIDVVTGSYNYSLISGQPRHSRLLLNDGRGALADVTTQRLPVDADLTRALALVDVDGDGDLDLLLGKAGAQNRLFRNDGTGIFADVTAQAMPVDAADTTAIAVGDVDGDGDVDVVFANSYPSGRQNFLYVNNGAGTFVDATAARLPVLADPTADVALADFDGDGDLDLLTVNGSSLSLNRMFWNDGTGVFSLSGGPTLPALYHLSSSVAVADVDGDQDLDFVVGNRANHLYSGRDRLMINDGTGAFVDETEARMPDAIEQTSWVEFGDIDGDLDPDLVVAQRGQNLVYVNDGSGSFARSATPLPRHDDGSTTLALFDVDGDGDSDLMFGNTFVGSAEQNRLYVNDGRGRFADGTLPRLPIVTSQAKSAVVFDADGDLDADLVVGYEYNSFEAGRLFLNDGRGVFDLAPSGQFPALLGNTRDLVAEDFDGDGDIDLVLALGYQQLSRFLLNDGAGGFTDEVGRLPVVTPNTEAIAAADVDDDGDVDLVLGNHYDANLLYLNDGTGVFADASAGRLPVDSDWAGDLAFADVDSDGDLDLIVANEQTQNRIYLNSGTGFFTDETVLRMPTDADRSVSVAVGDVDGDEDVDIVFGNSNEQQNRLYLNTGAGFFVDATPTQLPVDVDSTEGIALADLDGDGDLDLVVGNRGPTYENRRLWNDGSGTFAQEPLDDLLNLTSDVVVADIDGDGDVDVVQTNNGEELLSINRSMQLSAPVFASVGRGYDLDIALRPGALQQPAVAVSLMATARLPSPVFVAPIGDLWLAGPVFALPAVVLPDPLGEATATLAIPALPALVGVELHSQALLFDAAGPAAPRLTNLVSDTVRF